MRLQHAGGFKVLIQEVRLCQDLLNSHPEFRNTDGLQIPIGIIQNFHLFLMDPDYGKGQHARSNNF
jgi:hypothetical protein